MRISLLEKRENFFQILSDTLAEWDHINATVNESQSPFLVNRFLNFIAHPKLPSTVFSNLVKEYSVSQSSWKTPVQHLYVKMAVNKSLRPLLAHKKIGLPAQFAPFLILGGNHRLRLFDSDLNNSYVLLKKGESSGFINNELYVKQSFSLDYSPKLFISGNNWFKEEYFEGKPLNRIAYNKNTNKFIKFIVKSHIQQLLGPSQVSISTEEYIEIKRKNLLCAINQKNINVSAITRSVIIDTFNHLAKKLNNTRLIKLSWTHGDFQTGNILVSGSSYKVIDWEAADKRFWFYDLFVLLGNIRTHGNIMQALVMFENMKEIWGELDLLPASSWKVLIALEELLFNVNEDCSVNFYRSGEKSLLLCNQIKLIYPA